MKIKKRRIEYRKKIMRENICNFIKETSRCPLTGLAKRN